MKSPFGETLRAGDLGGNPLPLRSKEGGFPPYLESKMSDRNHSLTVSLGEARLDIEDVSQLSEADLESLGTDAKHLIDQIEDLAFQLAMLAEEKFENTRYCEAV